MVHIGGIMSEQTLGLRNIGPETEQWLLEAGITSKEQLIKVGAKSAYEMILSAGHEPNLNLYYSLIGAEEDLDWRIIADREQRKINRREADFDL